MKKALITGGAGFIAHHLIGQILLFIVYAIMINMKYR
jgi:nucleoside-diphosphate-sugar epimerase